MSNTQDYQFAAVPDIGYLGNDRYALSPMGLFDNLEDCVQCVAKCHASFGYGIYRVVKVVTPNIQKSYGMSRGKCPGYKILDFECYAFSHSSWPEPRKNFPI